MLPPADGYGADMAERDPHKEPENSTVHDWHGQKVDRDAQQADRLVEEAEKGLEDEAEETRAEAAFNDRTKD